MIKKQKKEISESVVEDDDANRERERKIGVTVRTLEVSFAEATVEVKENIFFCCSGVCVCVDNVR